MPTGARITRDARALDGVAATNTGTRSAGCERRGSTFRAREYLPRCSCSPTTGEKIPFGDDEIARLYGDVDALRVARARSIDDLVVRRLLLPADAATLREANDA